MSRLRSRLLLLVVLVLLTIMVCGPSAFSQAPPDQAEGTSPSATYHGGDFDFVDMATGRLHIHVPLFVDHSQRGNLNFTYSLTYTSTGAFDVYYVNNDLTYTLPAFGSPALATDGALATFLNSQVYVDKTITPYVYYYSYSLTEADGSMHIMGANGNGGMEAVDGSGLKYASNSTDKNGVQFIRGIGSTYIEDPNGNEMTTVGPTIVGNEMIYTMTDTVGRTWTTTEQSSDVSGCPTMGSVPPWESTIWTIPGPTAINNGTRTFKFCYTQYTLNNNNTTEPYIVNLGVSLLTTVILPDGSNWRFAYDNTWGDLTAVYPPTGDLLP